MHTGSSHSPSMQSAMQCDADGNLSPDQEDDQDSLFGSPPASPVRGRSPSPGLALPSASNSTQNVGTIALPGSQHCSELPVTPLALSLNYAPNGHPQRPPALSTIATSSGHTTPSSSRASSTGPGNRPKKKKNPKPKESTPRPPPPEIALPDPSGPIPANFLRNQSALLGTAGLVGGIRPSNLSMHRRPPGTVASNPIVIDDDERVPSRPSQASLQLSLEKLGIDPSILPAPSTREIMSVLMGQKDTFLVLQSLLKLSAEMNRPRTSYPSEPAPLTSFRRTSRSFQPSRSNVDVVQFIPRMSQNSSATHDAFVSSTGPPSKKRRLDRVPAGAADWDVPYPFPEGQGPEYYQMNWGRERGKQLMSQLVTLVKDAVRKAATRKYLQNEWEKKKMLEWQEAVRARASQVVEEPKVHGHYRPSTITYGLQGEAAAAARAQVQKVLTDASNSARASTAASLPIHQSAQASISRTPTPQLSTPFDQLILSILAATPGRDLAADCGASNTVDGNADVRADSSTPTSDVSTQDPDQGHFDNWMNILLQTFPMAAQDPSSSDHDMSGIPPQPDSSGPIPVDSDSGFFDLDSIFTDMNPVDSTWYDFGILNTEESTSSTLGPSHATEQPKTPSAQDNEPATPQQDFIIDPALLAISVPTAPVTSALTTSLEPPPSLRSSPIPSLSSFGDLDPSTPNSATWDMSIPEVFTDSGGDACITETGLVGGGYRTEGLVGQEEHLNVFIEAQCVGKGKGRDMGDTTAQASLLPIAVHPEAPRYSVASSSSSLRMSKDRRSLGRLQSSRADIMKRAAKRKKQLLTAIANIRTQLWETTIEQGVLLHMNKLCTHAA